MVDPRAMHVVMAYNGGILWDNGDSRESEYGQVHGYFVLYDLDAPKAKWIRKKKKKKKKKKKENKEESE